MASRKVFTTDLGVLTNFPEILANAIQAATDEVIKDNLKQIAGTRFDKFIKNKSAGLQITKFRNVLESFAPVIYFVDYVQLRKELQILKTEATRLRQEAPTGALREQIQSSLSYRDDAGIEAVIESIIEGVEAGVKQFLDQTKPQEIEYEVLANRYTLAGQFGLKDPTLRQRRPFRLKGTIGPNISEAFVFSTWDEVGEKLGRRINDNVAKKLKEQGASKLKSVLILGHAAAKSVPPNGEDEEAFYASTPKLTQILLEKVLDSVLSSPSSMPSVQVESLESMTLKFLEDTQQLAKDVAVEVDKQFATGFLEIFVKIGGQVLRGESTISNSIRSTKEKTDEASNSEVLNKLRLYYQAVLQTANSNINQKVTEILIDSLESIAINAAKSKSSPSWFSYVEDTVKAIFDGQKNIQPYSSSKAAKSKSSSASRTSKPVTKIAAKPKPARKLTAKPISFVAPRATRATVNLQSLMVQINSNLHAQIRRNMGTGSSKNLLNYRSGRFAQSVKIEKMSESRQGMISAFYSYMKNPYATFSEGGRQQYPRSRDPKTLISKSIRELAGAMISNRLRAINV